MVHWVADEEFVITYKALTPFNKPKGPALCIISQGRYQMATSYTSPGKKGT